jgi:hypothetical protein
MKMKKNNSLLLIIALLFIFISCEDLKDPACERGIAVVPSVSDVNPAIFDSKNLDNSYVQFVVDVPEGSHADKIEIVASYQDNLERVLVK